MELLNYRDYRDYLKNELESRASTNPNYSLRAFARDLHISPQLLSLVLNGKKSLSPDFGAEIADHLGLNPEDASHFLDLVMLAHSRSSQVAKLIEFRIKQRSSDDNSKYKNLDMELFKVIADWHHYAILELSLTDNFRSDSRWIASRLGITVFEAQRAIDRMKSLELLDEDRKGKLRKTEINIAANYNTPSAALRKLAKHFLEKAIDSLETQSVEERDLTNITMAIDPERLPEAKRMIRVFRRKLCAFLEQGHRTEVYTFAPSLFKLTKSPNKESKK